MSASWKVSYPKSFDSTCPVIHINGIESAYAVAIPVIRFVAPGPEVATQTPTLLLTLA